MSESLVRLGMAIGLIVLVVVFSAMWRMDTRLPLAFLFLLLLALAIRVLSDRGATKAEDASGAKAPD